MPTVTYTFQYPEEQADLLVCQKAHSYRHVLYQIVEQLRTRRKHGNLSPEAQQFADEWWTWIWDHLTDESIADEF